MNKLLTPVKKLAADVNEGYNYAARRSYVAVLAGVGMLASAVPQLSSAATTVGDMGNNVGDNSGGVTSGLLRAAGVIGFFMVVVGVIKIVNARKQQEGYGASIGMLFAGAFLLSIPTLVSIFNTSVLGTDASQTVQGQIIQ